MQFAGFHNFGQLPAQAHQLFVNRATVGLDLSFAGATDKAQPTPLAFKVGPSPYKPRALIAQCRHFDLQHAFAGACAIREDFQNQTGSVQKLDLPGLFQIALLNRRDRAIDKHKLDVIGFERGFQLFDFARSKQHAGLDLRQANDIGPDHLEIRQGRSKRNRLFQSRRGVTFLIRGFYFGTQHPCAGDMRIMLHHWASSPS